MIPIPKVVFSWEVETTNQDAVRKIKRLVGRSDTWGWFLGILKCHIEGYSQFGPGQKRSTVPFWHLQKLVSFRILNQPCWGVVHLTSTASPNGSRSVFGVSVLVAYASKKRIVYGFHRCIDRWIVSGRCCICPAVYSLFWDQLTSFF